MALPFIGSAVSIIGSAIGGIFSPEGKARRQKRRLERRQRKAARKAGKITVKEPAKKVPYYPPAVRVPEPSVAEIKAVGGKVPIGTWLKENWFIPAGGVAVIILLFLLLGKKKKVGGRRKNPGRPTGSKSNPSNPGSGSGSRSSKTRQEKFATRAKRVSREWGKAKAAGSKMGRKAAWAKFG